MIFFFFAAVFFAALFLGAEIRRCRAVKALREKQWTEGNSAVFAAEDALKKAWDSDHPAHETAHATRNLIQKMIDQDKREYPR